MRKARLAAGYILAHKKDSVTARELYRAHKEFQGDNRNPLISAMHQLELAGWVSPQMKQKGITPKLVAHPFKTCIWIIIYSLPNIHQLNSKTLQ